MKDDKRLLQDAASLCEELARRLQSISDLLRAAAQAQPGQRPHRRKPSIGPRSEANRTKSVAPATPARS